MDEGGEMKDYHTKPSNKVRSVEDALKDAERLRNELPRTVQVFARDWDKVILADRIAELETEQLQCPACGCVIAYGDFAKGDDIRKGKFNTIFEDMKCCGNCGDWKRIGCRGVEPEHCCQNWKPR